MKKHIIIFLLILALSSCGTHVQQYKSIAIDTPNIKESMKNFLTLDGLDYAKGTNFQVKLISLDRVDFMPSNEDINIMNYRYHFVIAPLTDKPLRIKKITLSLQNEAIVDYYKRFNVGGNRGLYDETVQVGEIDPKIQYMMWNKAEEMNAYEFVTTLKNTDIHLQKEKYDDSEFENSIKDLKIIIKSTEGTEEINISYPEVNYVHENDSILEKRKDLRELYKNNTTYNYLIIYGDAKGTYE